MNNVRKIIIILFSLIIIAPTVFFITFGDTFADTVEEKRELNLFPREIHDDYIQKVELWYKDHTPYRNALISFESSVKQGYKKYYINNINPALSKIFKPKWAENISNYLAPIGESDAVFGRDGWLFYSGEGNLNQYQALEPIDEGTMSSRRKTFEQLDDICKSKGINLVLIMTPNKEQLYSEYMPTYYVRSNEKNAQVFYDYMKDSTVSYSYLLDDLKDMKDDYSLYLKQDTHWNDIGAYAAIEYIYKSIGIDSKPIDELDISSVTVKGGDLTNFCGLESEYEDYKVRYREDVKVESSVNELYEYYLSSNPINNNEVVLIGDSFRTNLTQFLSKDFNTAYIIHRFYLTRIEDQEIIKQLNEGDTLIIESNERYDSSIENSAKMIIEILNTDT